MSRMTEASNYQTGTSKAAASGTRGLGRFWLRQRLRGEGPEAVARDHQPQRHREEEEPPAWE